MKRINWVELVLLVQFVGFLIVAVYCGMTGRDFWAERAVWALIAVTAAFCFTQARQPDSNYER